MRTQTLLPFIALAFLASCGEERSLADNDNQGVYGASSGPNPNLEDLQDNQAPSEAMSSEVPAAPPEQRERDLRTGPNEAAQPGRSSARTGASD